MNKYPNWIYPIIAILIITIFIFSTTVFIINLDGILYNTEVHPNPVYKYTYIYKLYYYDGDVIVKKWNVGKNVWDDQDLIGTLTVTTNIERPLIIAEIKANTLYINYYAMCILNKRPIHITIEGIEHLEGATLDINGAGI